MDFKQIAYTVLQWGGAVALIGYPLYQLNKLRRPTPRNTNAKKPFDSVELRNASASVQAGMKDLGIKAEPTPR